MTKMMWKEIIKQFVNVERLCREIHSSDLKHHLWTGMFQLAQKYVTVSEFLKETNKTTVQACVYTHTHTHVQLYARRTVPYTHHQSL